MGLLAIGNGRGQILPAPTDEREGQPEARKVLALFGFKSKDPTRIPLWPPDTYTANVFQMALEYMGYEVEFHDVATGRPPENLDEHYSAIICDSSLEIPFDDEVYYLGWILKHKARDVKLLFAGSFPGDDLMRRQLTEALGMAGSAEEVLGAKSATFDQRDPTMLDLNLLPKPRTDGLVAAQASAEAQVYLSISAIDRRDLEMRGDIIFSAPWGGAVLEPYLYFQTSPEDVRTVFDVFSFLAKVLPINQFPVPDCTTRDGLRLFFSHIDGDGFTTLTRTQFNTTCAEIVRDQFLKKYPFPTTVSVIEADTSALLKDQNPADRERYETIARSLFALGNVQAGSHAWSHPFCWMPGHDIEGGRVYEHPWLELSNPDSYRTFDLKREIEGSVSYIRDQLLPKDKQMEVFLWSGNCRPSGAALRMVRNLGLEALNGGQTWINRRIRGTPAISAKDTFMDGELQVYTGMQNEYVYTGGFTGPLYGGFRMVIDTFNMTETPRRLKPVNIYYHFYCAQTPDSLASLRDVHDWCASQPLHSITARDYVGIVRDARQTEVRRLGTRRWLIKNKGQCRTLRVPTAWGLPNFDTSRGVIGYTQQNDQSYITTDASGRAILDFNARMNVQRPYLVSSTGEIRLHTITSDMLAGTVRDLKPNAVSLGGMIQSQQYQLKVISGLQTANSVHLVDSAGVLSLTLPPVCAFSLTANQP
jgi:polysaccharide biosynthesis protein PelA